MLTLAPLNRLPRVRHAFFTRAGGVSEGTYRSLNCGYGSDDRPENVVENRARAMDMVELESDRLVTAYQTHSDRVGVVDKPWRPDAAPKVDAMVTAQPALALGILTADCAPVLFSDHRAAVVGAAHAGWRGALTGVLDAAVGAMEALGADRRRIVAGIGPCIGQQSYEVGPEFPQPFVDHMSEDEDLFQPATRDGRFLFDLKGYVARRLSRLGLGEVCALSCDTCAEEDRFFSFRRACLRGERNYGRGLSVIYLEP